MSNTDHIKSKLYYPSLNGVRFFAALIVIIHHLEHNKFYFDIPNYWNISLVRSAGKLGVILFFVLSGFLITNLLFAETKLTKTISIKSFYMRRVLRIWPLYFLIVLLAFFILPYIDFFSIQGFSKNSFFNSFSAKLLLFITMLPNVALLNLSAIPFASHLWSIGIEEQFYLVWPVFIKKFSNRKNTAIKIVFTYILVCCFMQMVWHYSGQISQTIFEFFFKYVDCLAIGSLFSFIVDAPSLFLSKLKSVIFNPYFQWFNILIRVFLTVFAPKIITLGYEIYALFFGIIICNLACNPKTIFHLEYKPLNYLGKISYGLYIYHPIAIITTIKLSLFMHQLNPFFILVLCLIITITLAAISYHYFEAYFINKKVKFSKVVSGDNAEITSH